MKMMQKTAKTASSVMVMRREEEVKAMGRMTLTMTAVMMMTVTLAAVTQRHVRLQHAWHMQRLSFSS
jgi:hypothetical protein